MQGTVRIGDSRVDACLSFWALQALQDVPPDLRPLEIEEDAEGIANGDRERGWSLGRPSRQQRLRRMRSDIGNPSSGRSTRSSSSLTPRRGGADSGGASRRGSLQTRGSSGRQGSSQRSLQGGSSRQGSMQGSRRSMAPQHGSDTEQESDYT